jgi:hypothetical protein
MATLAIIALVAVACSGPTNPTAGPSAAPTATVAPAGSPSSAPASPAATLALLPTALPATLPPGASLEPGASVPPSIDTFKVRRSADCLSDNGTGTVGSIRLTWTASGTTGVRISIDPPSPDVAYDYGFGDYPASGSAVVPFACDPPNHDSNGDYHLYVVTTLHDRGYAYYRYAKVYEVTPTAAP